MMPREPLRVPGAVPLLDSNAQAGMSLITVLLILVVVSLLGVAGIRISMMGERSTRNDRDLQLAWQSAEAALIDAELDILGAPADSSAGRGGIFRRGSTDVSKFLPGCGDSSEIKNRGLCYSLPGFAPDWLTVDLASASGNSKSVGFGAFTGRSFPSGQIGIQPSAPPRYVIELVEDPDGARTTAPKDRKYVYRVTAMGFGPSSSTQSVLQIVYRN